ncbi:MAG: hypothetical protein ACYC3I_23750, partial [Gemmataceae bacterium]
PPHADGSPQAVRQLLAEADESVRAARARCRDWTADEAALLQDVLDKAAQALVSPSAAGEETAVALAAKEVLEQRGQSARQLVLGLQQTLAETLQSLRQADAAVQADISAIREMTFLGLPSPEIPHMDAAAGIGAPWWTTVLPSLAVGSTRRRLAETLGRALREQVELRDRQIHAWVKQSLSALIESYDIQAEIFRTRVQRVNEAAEKVGNTEDASGLAEDLQTLRQAEAVSPSSDREEAPNSN